MTKSTWSPRSPLPLEDVSRDTSGSPLAGGEVVPAITRGTMIKHTHRCHPHHIKMNEIDIPPSTSAHLPRFPTCSRSLSCILDHDDHDPTSPSDEHLSVFSLACFSRPLASHIDPLVVVLSSRSSCSYVLLYLGYIMYYTLLARVGFIHVESNTAQFDLELG